MDKAFQGRSNRIGNSPYFGGLFFSLLCTTSYLGYKGAKAHNNWGYFIKQPKRFATVYLGFYAGFLVYNTFLEVGKNSHYGKRGSKMDFKVIKEDMRNMGMIRDDKQDK